MSSKPYVDTVTLSPKMPNYFDTMPKRVVVMATTLSILILGLAALLFVFYYRAHEIREFNQLLDQDTQIIVQNLEIAPSGQVSQSTYGVKTLYDHDGSNWVWQLFRTSAPAPVLVGQSHSLGTLDASSPALGFPDGPYSEFSTEDGLRLRGKLTHFSLKGEDYAFGIAGPVLHVTKEVNEAADFIGISFFGLGCVLSLMVFYVVRSGLKPLNRLQKELEQMKEGHGTISDKGWTADLEPIVGELRALDGRINSLVERHRRQSSDLAHSLKTPLAIMSRIVSDVPQPERARIVEQTDRITTAVRRNLSRLRTGAITATSTPVHDAVEEIVFAMEVLFRERSLDIRNRIGKEIVFRGDPDDFKEIVGNLLDNACKWAVSTIHIDCDIDASNLVLRISDDGLGMSKKSFNRPPVEVVDRGEGEFVSGVGLLIVHDIAELYEGSVRIGTSQMGGTEVQVTLPAGPSSN